MVYIKQQPKDSGCDPGMAWIQGLKSTRGFNENGYTQHAELWIIYMHLIEADSLQFASTRYQRKNFKYFSWKSLYPEVNDLSERRTRN